MCQRSLTSSPNRFLLGYKTIINTHFHAYEDIVPRLVFTNTTSYFGYLWSLETILLIYINDLIIIRFQ